MEKFDIDNIDPSDLGLEKSDRGLSANEGKNWFCVLTSHQFDALLRDITDWLDPCRYSNTKGALMRLLDNAGIEIDPPIETLSGQALFEYTENRLEETGIGDGSLSWDEILEENQERDDIDFLKKAVDRWWETEGC